MAVAPRRSGPRPHSATRAPSATRPWHRARPRPSDPPVTSTTRPSICTSMVSPRSPCAPGPCPGARAVGGRTAPRSQTGAPPKSRADRAGAPTGRRGAHRAAARRACRGPGRGPCKDAGVPEKAPPRGAAGRGRRGRGDRPSGLLLFPGAGASSTQPALVAIDDAVEAEGLAVTRADFPYRLAGRRAPDRAPVLIEAVVRAARAHVGAEQGAPGTLALGGRSMGGRMCSMAVAEGLPAAALVLVSYPLHPPGRPERLRTEHFSATGPALPLRLGHPGRLRLARRAGGGHRRHPRPGHPRLDRGRRPRPAASRGPRRPRRWPPGSGRGGPVLPDGAFRRCELNRLDGIVAG